MAMDIIHSVAALRERLQREPNNVFVPTMGNLHEGHIELIRVAKGRAACTVVSIFVNRLQFGPREDFDRYPRTLPVDSKKLKEVGVNVVFAPDEKEIYPDTQTFVVEPSDLQHILEGAHRPGHFRGVATVVLKLFNLVQPHSAVFGKKDYQQYLVLRDMVKQFALPIEIIPAETVRAPDGLALSSRNSFLSSGERAEAPRLYRLLSAASEQVMSGARDYQRMELDAMAELARHGWRPDYVAIRRQGDLQPAKNGERELVVLAAARLGRTRLIDNVEVFLN
jgi:pantoate--beta-alanine ligase